MTQERPRVTFPSCLSPLLSSRLIRASHLLPSFPGLCTYLSIWENMGITLGSPQQDTKLRGLSGGQTSPYKLGIMALYPFTCLEAHMTSLLFNSWSSFILGVAEYVHFFSNKYVFDTYRQLFKKNCAYHYTADEGKSCLYINMPPSYMCKCPVI